MKVLPMPSISVRKFLSSLVAIVLSFVVLVGTLHAATPSYDLKDYANLTAAVAALGQAPAILKVSEPQAVTTLVVPQNVTLQIEPGGVLLVARGTVVELHGPLIAAPSQQIFQGEGLVRLEQGSVKEAYPQWWGAKGDGVANDRTALQKCFHYDTVNLGAGAYNLGDLPSSDLLIFQFMYRKNITIKGNGATIVCNSLEHAASHVLYFNGCENVHVSGVNFKDLGYRNDLSSAAGQGAIFMSLWSTLKGGGNILIDSVNVDSAMAFLIVGNSTGNKNRVHNIEIKNVTVSNSYYGINCQNNGDDMLVRGYSTYFVKRSYFVYGVSNHDVDVYSDTHQQASADVLLKTYDHSTTDLTIRYKSRNNLNPDAIVCFEHQSAVPVSIQNVRVTMDIDAAVKGTPVVFRSYTPEGAIEQATKQQWRDIELSGNVNVSVPSILVVSRQETKYPITLRGQLGIFDMNSLKASFVVRDERL